MNEFKWRVPPQDFCHIIKLNARYAFWPLRRYAKRRSLPDVPLFLDRIRERLHAERSTCLVCGKPTKDHAIPGWHCATDSGEDIPTFL